MEGGITKQILDFISNLLPYVINNSGQIFDFIILLAELLAVFLWFYCGYYIYVDAKKRYYFRSSAAYYAFLILGIVTGPIGLGFYILTRPAHTFDELEFMKVEHKFYYHQASKVLDCIKCGAYVLEGHTHCTNCGTQNRYRCENCQALTDYDDMFCNSCGYNFNKRYDQIYESVLTKAEKSAIEREAEENSNFRPGYDLSGALVNFKSRASNVYGSVSSKVKDASQKAVTKASEVAKKIPAKADSISKKITSKKSTSK